MVAGAKLNVGATCRRARRATIYFIRIEPVVIREVGVHVKSTKLFAASAIVLAVVLATSVAFAATSINLVSSKSEVVYPHSVKLRFRTTTDTASSVPATVTIQYRPIGQDAWKTVRTVVASRSAQQTLTVEVAGPRFLRGTTAFRAIAGSGIESQIVTVSVAARLSGPSVHASRGTLLLHGTILPGHKVGSKPIVLEFAKLGTVAKGKHTVRTWVPVPDMTTTAKMVGGKGQKTSTQWVAALKLTKDMKGTWKVKASHEDTSHVLSFSERTFTVHK